MIHFCENDLYNLWMFAFYTAYIKALFAVTRNGADVYLCVI